MRKWWLVLTAATAAVSLLACSEALQNGTIAGNVKDDGQNVSGAIVVLLDEGQMLGGSAPLSNGSITGGNGNYTIFLVEPDKNYYVVAVKDEDSDMKYTPGVDPIGYYGTYNQTTHLWVPSVVSIGSGENKTGINVADMYIIPIP